MTPIVQSRSFNAKSAALVVTASLICAFPLAQGIGAVSPNAMPEFQVNRAVKGDRIAAPRPAARKVPVQIIRNPDRPVREQSDKRQMLDGCESSFSPVAVPSMAHVAGRCVG